MQRIRESLGSGVKTKKQSVPPQVRAKLSEKTTPDGRIVLKQSKVVFRDRVLQAPEGGLRPTTANRALKNVSY